MERLKIWASGWEFLPMPVRFDLWMNLISD
jgi:hypothetical protein